VSCFCAEIQLLGKIPENTAKFLFYQKTHRARRRDGEGLGGRLMRVNSTNVLDEGLRIGEIGHRMKSKVRLVEIGLYQK
jgi:hypothetical protein